MCNYIEGGIDVKHLGIEVTIKNVPSLDPGFLPLNRYYESFRKDAKEPFDIAVERASGWIENEL